VAVLNDFRQDITARKREFLEMIASVEEAVGQPIVAETYKRPKPTDDEELKRFFAWKGKIGCVREEPFSEGVFTPELADRVRKFLEDLMPLYDYFNRFKV
jgi:hypothetical protein